MGNYNKNANYSKVLRELLLLRYEPIAVRMVSEKSEIPEGAIHPKRDMGKHIALCQAFGMARREKKTFFMDKTSEWCWNPLVGFGFVDCSEGSKPFEIICSFLGIQDPDAAHNFFAQFPRLPYKKYSGMIVGPLDGASSDPDVLLIYCNNAQLRSLIWVAKNLSGGKLVETSLDAIDSCVYSCVVPMQTGEYRVTLPDFGEHERAMADEDEIILSVPGKKIEELVNGLQFFHEKGIGAYTKLARDILPDFPRPPFYNELYEIWGLDKGDDWSR